MSTNDEQPLYDYQSQCRKLIKKLQKVETILHGALQKNAVKLEAKRMEYLQALEELETDEYHHHQEQEQEQQFYEDDNDGVYLTTNDDEGFVMTEENNDDVKERKLLEKKIQKVEKMIKSATEKNAVKLEAKRQSYLRALQHLDASLDDDDDDHYYGNDETDDDDDDERYAITEDDDDDDFNDKVKRQHDRRTYQKKLRKIIKTLPRVTGKERSRLLKKRQEYMDALDRLQKDLEGDEEDEDQKYAITDEEGERLHDIETLGRKLRKVDTMIQKAKTKGQVDAISILKKNVTCIYKE